MSVLQRGEVANRILSVGSMDRALMIADQLQGAEPGAPLFQHLSGRGFLTITGAHQLLCYASSYMQFYMPEKVLALVQHRVQVIAVRFASTQVVHAVAGSAASSCEGLSSVLGIRLP
jgi:hypothetical protein